MIFRRSKKNWTNRAFWPAFLLLLLVPVSAPATDCAKSYFFTAAETHLSSAEIWDQTMGAAWENVIRDLRVSPAGTVIEVAPGDRAKVGYGLAGIDFRGTLYVVEPNGPSLARVLEKYQRLLPNAKVVGVEKTLDQALPELPKHADALVANHPLDDMILADRLSTHRGKAIFDDAESMDSASNVKAAWDELSSDQPGLAQAQKNTVAAWLSAVDALQPNGLGISQYESGFFRSRGITAPDAAAGAAVNTLQIHLGKMDPLLKARLTRHRVQPERWVVAHLRKPTGELPGAVERLGADMFVAAEGSKIAPEFRTPVFSSAGASAEESEKFALRISPGASGGEKVKVYVDRQKDPLKVAMNGNAGSGRAAYVTIDGHDLNLKGLGRTPLATSSDKNHSDGALDLPNAIWEMMGSNMVHSNFRTSASPVVAIFDRGDLIRQEWNQFPMSAAVVARRDLSGSLDRPTHIFESGKPVPRRLILQMARRFGEQDAEKYVERVVHGAWSAGNISTAGHMIDFDSIAALKGRAANYTLTGRWVGNQFGTEGLGQLQVLDSLLANPLNVEKVTSQEVRHEFWKGRRKMMELRFPDLMGAPPSVADGFISSHQPEMAKVVGSFDKLGRYMYPNFRAMAAWKEKADQLSVFDISRFFRLYPLMRAAGKADPESLLQMMMNRGSTKNVASRHVSQDVVNLLKGDGVLVDSSRKLRAVEEEARDFIRKYTALMDDLVDKNGGNANAREVAAQAYRANEDRYYLNYREETNFVEDLAAAYQSSSISRVRLNRVLGLLEQANDRLPIPDGPAGALADLRIYREGWTARRLLKDGTYREVVGIFDDGKTVPGNAQVRTSLGRLSPVNSPASGETLFEGPPRQLDELLGAPSELSVVINGQVQRWGGFGRPRASVEIKSTKSE